MVHGAMDTLTGLGDRLDGGPADVDCAPGGPDIYQPFSCGEALQLPSVVPNWNVEFSQLSAGDFKAIGSSVTLDCLSIVRFTIDQTTQHVVSPPHGSTAIMLPGAGSRSAFTLGRQIALGECVSVPNNGRLVAITRDHYVAVALAVDDAVWSKQAHWLDPRALAARRSARVETPGPEWIARTEATVDWIVTAMQTHPQAASRAEVRGSLADQMLLALSNLGNPETAAHYSRDARAHQRLAVERAREYIQAKLSEPLRLSDLCSHARIQARSLEYGFREIVGLSPIAYVKRLRLNAVRRSLSHRMPSERSITEIAMDQGFWHLSQFAIDYRKLFGELPSVTRKRALAGRTAN